MDATRAPLAEPLLLTVDNAAQCLGISKSKFYGLIRAREIPTLMLHGNRRVAYVDLKAYVDQLRQQSAA